MFPVFIDKFVFFLGVSQFMIEDLLVFVLFFMLLSFFGLIVSAVKEDS